MGLQQYLALQLIINLLFHTRTKHIETDHHFVQEKVALIFLVTGFVSSNDLVCRGVWRFSLLLSHLYQSHAADTISNHSNHLPGRSTVTTTHRPSQSEITAAHLPSKKTSALHINP